MPYRFLLIATTALAPLIWGSTYLVTTEFLPPDRPLTAALLRVLPAGLLLLLWRREWPQPQEWWRLLCLGVLNIGFFQAMLFVAAYRLPGGLAAVLMATQTLMVLALTHVIGRQRQPAAAWRAALIGVFGVALLVSAPQAGVDGWGVAAAVAGAAAMALGLFLSKYWKSSLSLWAFTGWQLVFGGLCLLPFAWWLEPALPALTLRHIGGYLYLCLFGALLAYALFFRGVRLLPAATVSALGLLSPVCAFVLGWLFLGQGMGATGLLGFVLVLYAVFGVQQALQAASK